MEICVNNTISFGVILPLVIISRLFIYSFGDIHLTGQTGSKELLYASRGGIAPAFFNSTLPLLAVYLMALFIVG
jgi:hypothetical protein